MLNATSNDHAFTLYPRFTPFNSTITVLAKGTGATFAITESQWWIRKNTTLKQSTGTSGTKKRKNRLNGEGIMELWSSGLPDMIPSSSMTSSGLFTRMMLFCLQAAEVPVRSLVWDDVQVSVATCTATVFTISLPSTFRRWPFVSVKNATRSIRKSSVSPWILHSVDQAMDCFQMTFPPASFDSVIDKSTMDTFFCSETLLDKIPQYLDGVAKVLKKGSYFLIVSFNEPKVVPPSGNDDL